MMPALFTKKVLFYSALFSLILVGLITVTSVNDDQTKIVFCDVGQGDATYIRVKNRVDLLIDAGPNQKILTCLGKHMPFYDRKIELAIISHPQTDHFGGLLSVINRYQINRLIIPPLDQSSQSFAKLKHQLATNNILILTIAAGDRIKLLTSQLVFIWPSREWLEEKLIFDRQRKIANQVLGISGLDPNFFSLIFSFKENQFIVLFTGDSPDSVLNGLLQNDQLNTTILKVPHHGSKNGLTKRFLDLSDPSVAVISVGKNNSYGHPHQQVLDMLKAKNINIRRTDEEGNIVFKVRSQNSKVKNASQN